MFYRPLRFLANLLNLRIAKAQLHISPAQQQVALVTTTTFGLPGPSLYLNSDKYDAVVIHETAEWLRSKKIAVEVINCDSMGCRFDK